MEEFDSSDREVVVGLIVEDVGGELGVCGILEDETHVPLFPFDFQEMIAHNYSFVDFLGLTLQEVYEYKRFKDWMANPGEVLKVLWGEG